MDFETIIYEIQEHILTITLSRPDRLNAFTDDMRTEIVSALDAADDDDAVRAIIFTGAGRGFCAGVDLSGRAGASFDRKYRSNPTLPDGTQRDSGGMLTLRIFESKKPIIAAINGPAAGIGVTMTLPMDIRIASTNAKFGFVFTRRGIVPEGASSWFLPRVVGISQAMEWAATGRVFDAEEALRGRLIRSIHEPGELLGEARELAHEIADNAAPVSVALARRMMWNMLGASHPWQAHEAESKAMQARGASADAHEGVNSFLEKRPAVFIDKVSGDLPEIGF